jgi:hypothetical protein
MDCCQGRLDNGMKKTAFVDDPYFLFLFFNFFYMNNFFFSFSKLD